MNINLVYEGKNFNFDIPNGVTIDYLKELSSKIFNSDKAILDLVYNNKKFQINDNNTLIRDLITEGEKNIILTVQINKNIKDKKKDEEIPLVTLKTRSNESNGKELKKDDEGIRKEKHEKSKKIENNKIIFKKSSDKKENYKEELNIFKKINKHNKNILIINNNKNFNIIKKELDIKTFESIYIKKNRELLSLMHELNNKIKEVYLSLYKKYKSSGTNSIINNISSSSNNTSISSIINSNLNNNAFYELTLYEKKLIDFQEKQIKYYKRLLVLIQKYNKNGDFSELNEFFINLALYGINNNIKDNTKFIEKLKSKKITNNNILSMSNSLLGSSSPKIQNSILPPLTTKNNSSSVFEKKNNSINLKNNFSIVTPIKSNKKNKISNNLNYEQSEDEKTKNINNFNSPNNSNKNNKIILNNLNSATKIPKYRRASVMMESKLTMNKLMNKYLNNANNENNNDTNNSADSSEKNKINKNNNEASPLKVIKRSPTNNYHPIRRRQFSAINFDKLGCMGYNLEKGSDDKLLENKRSSNFRYSSFGPIYSLKNKLNDSPKKSKRITIDKNSPIIIRKKDRNNSLVDNNINNNKKISNIDVSSMTVNDSNFGRDKSYIKAKKIKKGINKYDFFM